jgi:antitoxin CptB
MRPLNQAERARLRWRCRRGMKELDLLLGRYLEDRFDAAPEAERAAFEALLEAQDPLIYAYCLGLAPVPTHWSTLIARITGRPPAGRPAAEPSPAEPAPAARRPSGPPSAGRPSG